MAKKKTGSSTGKVMLIGAGLVAAATAAYFLSSPKRRAAAKSWAIKMKADVIEKLERAKDLSEDQYHTLIDQVSAKYAKVKDAAPEEISEVVADLKKKWSHLRGGAKKSAKKAVKKVTKKSSKK